MKNKVAKIVMALTLVLLAPLTMILTGCINNLSNQSLKFLDFNRTEFYLGEDFDDTKWACEYFDGETTVTFNVTKEMVSNFSVDRVKTDIAKITYKGITISQRYTVKGTPFDTSKVYRCTNEGDIKYLKIDNEGGYFEIATLNALQNVSKSDTIWGSPQTIRIVFKTYGFKAGKWSVEGDANKNYTKYEIKATQLSKTSIRIFVKITPLSGEVQYEQWDFNAI